MPQHAAPEPAVQYWILKRLPRILLNTTTLFCVLLILATIVFWVRSEYIIRDVLVYHSPAPDTQTVKWIALASTKGDIVFIYLKAKFDSAASFQNRKQYVSGIAPGLSFNSDDNPYPTRIPRVQPPVWPESGFKAIHNALVPPARGMVSQSVICLSAPHWFLLLLFALLPGLRLLLLIRSRLRYKSGQCPTCGYDLRATPNQCPECGRAPALL